MAIFTRHWAALVAASFLTSGLAVPPSAVAGKLNVKSKSSVLKNYRKLLRTAKVKPQWSGSLEAGIPGGVSGRYQSATLRAVNFYRAMAGVGPVAFREDWNQKAAAAALMMAGENSLSHFPGPTWKFYTAAGAEAAGKSNLALGNTGPLAVAAYIEDDGSNNERAGHRRWILYPALSEMGSGNAYSRGKFGANALWVLPDRTRLSTRQPRDNFVAWPPPGMTPNTLVHERWSFSMEGASFDRAKVTVRDGKKRVGAKVVNREPGTGSPGIVFEPKLRFRENTVFSLAIDDGTYLLATDRKPRKFRVTVSNVRIMATGKAKRFSYVVTVFPVKIGR
ncbi:MAG: CAP domain-containing protein [Chthoniobacterales bacterium]